MPRRSAALVLLVGLIGADVVLVTGALRSTHVNTAQLAREAAAETASPAPSDTPSDGATPTTATAATGASLLGKVTVAGLTSTRAWRAATPSMACTKGAKKATIGHTEDGGQHWTDVQVPMSTVAGLSFAGGKIIATGLDSSCQPTTYALTSHSTPQKVGTKPSWAIDPTDLTKLLSSGDPVTKQPCKSGVLDVAANTASNVVALCADGSVQHSTNSGTSWKSTGPRPGALAIATNSNAVYTATRTKCGIAVSSKTADNTTNCVSETKKWKGAVDLTVVDGTVWLVGSDTAVTEPVANVN